MYYFIGSVFLLLALVLLIQAIRDIIKTRRNKGLIILLLMTPILGPLIYFQTK